MVILSPRASGFAELGLEGCDPRDRAAELGREGRDGLSNQPFWGYENLGKPDQSGKNDGLVWLNGLIMKRLGILKV